jgi:hypothetical protein
MKNLTAIIRMLLAIAGLKGAKFISLKGYVSTESGEIADYVINTNISVMEAKKKDLETLQNCNTETLKVIKRNTAKDIALEIYSLAYAEMLESASKNVSVNPEDRTTASQAQTDAYEHLTNGIKVCKSTDEVHIFGMIDQKNLVKAGTYKEVKSSDKTLAKKAITKQLNLRAGKFRTFKVLNVAEAKVSGEYFEVSL